MNKLKIGDKVKLNNGRILKIHTIEPSPDTCLIYEGVCSPFDEGQISLWCGFKEQMTKCDKKYIEQLTPYLIAEVITE